MPEQTDGPGDGLQPTFNEVVSLAFTRIDGDGADGTIAVTPAMHQPDGIVHGGVYCTLIESAASYGAGRWLGDRGRVVGVSNHTNFLRAVRSGVLAVSARPVHRGRTQQVWAVEIRDEPGRLVATGEVRLANLTSTEWLGQP